MVQQMMSIADFCGHIGKDYSFWGTLKKNGNLPKTIKIGGRSYITVEAFDEWFRNQESCDENAEAAEYYAKEAIDSQRLGDFARASDCWQLSIFHTRNPNDIHRRTKWFRRCVEASCVTKDTINFIRSSSGD